MRVERVPPTHPDALRLIEEVQQVYVGLYGGQDTSPILDGAFEGEDGAFFVGYLDGEPVASGAWRRSDVEAFGTRATAEIKRMYVVPARQRRGLARRMLRHLEESAAAAGIEAMVLETGSVQPEAMALYESSGYERIAGFGHYRDEPMSRSFGRPLLTDERRLWDAEAERFDDEPDHGLGDSATRAAWRDLLLDVLPDAPARIADLGCGTGTLSVLLAAEGYDVTGLDFSPPMVERARAKAEAAGVAVQLVVGDANRPPLDAAGYDVVLDRHVLWAMDDPQDALRRWADLLVPGGLLVLVEGRWGPSDRAGVGLTATRTVELLRSAGRAAEVRPMPEPVFWGGETGDERYLVISRRSHDVHVMGGPG